MDKVTADVLAIDPERVAKEIEESLRAIVSRELHRRGGVVGVSGGIDSSVTVGLCARAFGPERTLALLMPETDSDPETLDISRQVADAFGVQTVVEDITEILQATGCYERREEAVRSVIPQYGIGWKFKIVLPSVVGNEGYRLFSLVAQAPNGETIEVRLPAEQYRTIVAATNFKQRTRKMLEYFHADRLNYAVIGTPNRLEYDQGFFVKLGDGAADAKPIAHLYKSQVYELARHIGVPDAVLERPPTTDTYSLPAEPGGVLLLAALRGHGPLPVRAQPGAAARGRCGRGVAETGAGSARVRRHRPEAANHPLPAPGAAARRSGLRRLSTRYSSRARSR